jgi:quercetin dioxygenase-like cupin family protein
MNRLGNRWIGALAVAALTVIAPISAGEAIKVVAPDAIDYVQEAKVPGVATAIVAGDPAQGPYTMRARLAPGAKVPAHTHPDERTVTVLAGIYYLGIGMSFDENQLHAYEPGTVIVVPAQTPHYLWAKDGEVIIQETGNGPTATILTNP